MKDLLCGFLAARNYNVVSTTENNTNNDNNNCNNGVSPARMVFNRLFRDRVPQISRPVRTAERRRVSCAFVLMIVGMITIATGCLVLVFKPYDIIFRYKLVFGDGGETYELWKKPPVNIYLKVYLFNITNGEEFLSGQDDKLNMVEVGPYVYQEDLTHSNVTFNANGTLSMVPKHPLKWVPDQNTLSEDDLLTLPNIAVLSIANLIKDKSYFTRMGLNLLIAQTDSRPIVQMTAREFMFGYESPLVTLGNKFMKSWIHFDKLGIIDRMYEFGHDHATIYTGESDLKIGGLIDTYNGAKNLPQWSGEHCSSVDKASDSTKFPSYIEPDDKLLFFRKSVCRAVPLERIGESMVSGLKSYDYTFEKDALDNGVNNPKNKCFCRNDKCLPSGLIDVTECYYGFPIAASFPHFYDSDPALLDMVNGSVPVKEKHGTIFRIEPKSGLPLEVAVRFQINLAIGDVKSISRVDKFSGVVLPLLWTEIRMDHLPDDIANLFNLYLNILPVLQDGAVYLLFCTGAATLLYSIIKAVTGNRESTISMQGTSGASRQKRCSAYLDSDDKTGTVNSREMELYYSSLLSNLKESDIV